MYTTSCTVSTRMHTSCQGAHACKLFSVVAVSAALSDLPVTDSFVACSSETYLITYSCIRILNSIDRYNVPEPQVWNNPNSFNLYSNLLLFKMVSILYKENYYE